MLTEREVEFLKRFRWKASYTREDYPTLWDLAEKGYINFPSKYRDKRVAVLTREGRERLAKEEKKAAEASQKTLIAV